MNVLSEKAKKFTEAFEHCMKNEPLALRNAMGMNRQQFKSMQREQKKMEEAMKKLTPVQFKLIDMLIRQERRKSRSRSYRKNNSIKQLCQRSYN